MNAAISRSLIAGATGVAAGIALDQAFSPASRERADSYRSDIAGSDLPEATRSEALARGPKGYEGLAIPGALGAGLLGTGAVLGGIGAMNFMLAGDVFAKAGAASALAGVGVLAGMTASYALL